MSQTSAPGHKNELFLLRGDPLAARFETRAFSARTLVRGFESRLVHGYLSLFSLGCVVCRYRPCDELIACPSANKKVIIEGLTESVLHESVQGAADVYIVATGFRSTSQYSEILGYAGK
jgi:hypothetical protein